MMRLWLALGVFVASACFVTPESHARSLYHGGSAQEFSVRNMPDAQDVLTAIVRIALDDDTNANTQWELSGNEVPVLLEKLTQTPEEQPMQPHLLYRDVPNRSYRGVSVEVVPFSEVPVRFFVNEKGVYEGTEANPTKQFRRPYNRDLEYWLLGSAPTRGLQLKILQMVPVVTFGQCVKLNNLIVNTVPRQCVLANNNILLETREVPSYESLQITTFEECLKDGKALIDTFPRRCLVDGGRVFTEQPKSRQFGG